MNKWQSLHAFWASFGLPAYEENTTPDTAELPYITYEASASKFNGILPLTASLWYRSTSWKEISDKSDEIAEALTPYYSEKIDNGYIVIRQRSPFAQQIGGEKDIIRRIAINISVEFTTEV